MMRSISSAAARAAFCVGCSGFMGQSDHKTKERRFTNPRVFDGRFGTPFLAQAFSLAQRRFAKVWLIEIIRDFAFDIFLDKTQPFFKKADDAGNLLKTEQNAPHRTCGF